MIRFCSSNGTPNVSRLIISNVVSEFCSISLRGGLVNCVMFTNVVSLCRSMTYQLGTANTGISVGMARRVSSFFSRFSFV